MKRYISASKWNNDWRYDIPGEVRSRLADCNNTWNDIKVMGRAMKVANPDRSAEDCAERILDWVLDWNNQFDQLDPTEAQYKELIKYIEG